MIHELARCGLLNSLQSYFVDDQFRLPNTIKETPLHLAAEAGNIEDVRLLLDKGAPLDADIDGCTPLHSAAMATSPNHEVAIKLLIEAAATRPDCDELGLLNRRREGDKNTALHLATGNANISQQFISQLKDANPQRRNEFQDTPFHVAAKSSNPKAIIYMLNTFSPLREGWDIDDVDRNQDPKTKKPLLTICAISCNNEAVAVLIQHGADISQGVLREIVHESVKSPLKIDKLLAVYRTIVDNVVTWKCLEKNKKTWAKDSEEYAKCFRETITSLITKSETDDKPDVLECAIKCGASKCCRKFCTRKECSRSAKTRQVHCLMLQTLQ